MKKQDILFLLTFTALVIAVVLMSLCTTSCARRVVEVPHVIVDWQRDTLMQTDSIYIDRWHTLTMSGDTVFRTDSVLVERWKVRSDIREVIKHDSITVPMVVETVKEVPTRTAYDKTVSWLFWLGVLSGAVVLGFKYIKWRIK